MIWVGGTVFYSTYKSHGLTSTVLVLIGLFALIWVLAKFKNRGLDKIKDLPDDGYVDLAEKQNLRISEIENFGFKLFDKFTTGAGAKLSAYAYISINKNVILCNYQFKTHSTIDLASEFENEVGLTT